MWRKLSSLKCTPTPACAPNSPGGAPVRLPCCKVCTVAAVPFEVCVSADSMVCSKFPGFEGAGPNPGGLALDGVTPLSFVER
eukprot:1388530-Amphidinium_carterae.1